jgi:hypothetical protein
LRHQTFFSLTECNEAIGLVMQRMNGRPMRKLGVSRRELFETIERSALNKLPDEEWEFAEFVVRSFRQQRAPAPNREIAAHGFFSLEALPEDTTRGTRARITEVMLGAPLSERW